jgi:glyoxylase-like metal-dependent hydrolase (beta-lactamase superfamily II)
MADVSRVYHVGSLELRTVADAILRTDIRRLFINADEAEFSRWVQTDPDGLTAMSVSGLLFRSYGKTILVDTGIGILHERSKTSNAGHLLRNMAAIGVTPEMVDVVINTHAHFDHIGWNTHLQAGELRLTFPNATYYLLDEEYAYYTQEAQLAAQPILRQTLLPLAASGRLVLAQDNTMVTPEVRIFRSPGHTAGHICVAITSGGETAVFLGDLTHHPAEFANPEWVGAWDLLPQTLVETRRRLMREAVEKDFLLVTAHHAFPGFGKAIEREGRFAWQPV